MRIEKFEKFECWKEAKKLVNMVYDAVTGSKAFQKDMRFASQITSTIQN